MKGTTNDLNPQDLRIGDNTIEYVEEYIYLGEMIK